MEAELLRGLNEAQRSAVTSPARVLQVLAPPGSGKTKTLTCRVAYLIAHHGFDPQRVICCTFTIKASREMRERLRGLLGCEVEAKLVLGTFHSICRRYLVAYGHLIGVLKSFGIADSSDSMNIIKRIIKRLNLSIDPRAARSKISSHKAKGKKLEDLRKTPQKHLEKQEFITVFHEYEEALATSKLLDYDDLLLRCVELFRAWPGCASNIEALLIDEFQDTNIVQFELMKLLASASRRVTIVGDPDQSIYGFRSAEIENLRRMKAFYPETVVINLEQNYRSASSVLRLAQEVIEQDTARPQKRLKATHCLGTKPVLRRLPNPNEEAFWIASEIKRMTVMTGGLLVHSDFAILLRSAFLSLLIEKALANSGIPYRMVGGTRFFDRVEIRIIVDYLRTISHPDNNQALLAIINVPSRKIGEATIAELIKLGEEQKLSLWTVVQRVLCGDLTPEKKLSKPCEQELGRLIAMIKNARQKMETMMPATVPSKLIDLIVKSLDFENYLKKKYKDDHEDRIENVKELLTHASEVLLHSTTEDQLAQVDGIEQQPSDGAHEVLSQFLANIVLSTDVDNSEDGNDKPRVTISTIHSAKGLEWPVVFIPAVYEGSIPHSRSEDTDEERRLLYVAMTRAQALLTLTFPLTQSRDNVESSLSQFLPPKLHHHVAQVGPLFDDKTIADIASILGRPMPSQEELVRSLQSLAESDSQLDNVWPSDGTRRPTLMLPSNGQHMPDFSRPLGEVLAASYKQQGSQHPTLSRSHSIPTATHTHQVATTMSNIGAFSTSNMSLGFTTARRQLKSSAAESNQSPPESLPPQKKVKLSRSASAQGTIASFFSKPKSQNTLPVEPDLPQLARPEPFQRPRPVPPIPTPSAPIRRDIGESGIPSELSSHRPDFRNVMTYKRPTAALKESSTNPNSRYANLYSSSPPPPDCNDGENRALLQKDNIQEDNSGAQPLNASNLKSASASASASAPTAPTAPAPAPAPLTNYILSRPAKTMHKTSVSSIGQGGFTSSSTSMTGMGRKTLGVRRSMNGWDNRKNK
ncbi:ATP-dependent DNA helicase srs2 [Exophiala dermatitidis]|uniref:DNA 3'-5' helicase n=1 Tax=Exophiala dermatitidis (strain ATCC 34100 / CBS 525.76 / NIH/UT8656) TaxID=858893 RepID=H6BKD4_EXODN|nr:DNA helicase II/ATP-dependent DNA helicase PcrA [Exophiala dermatitidis NIH/UT8656]EHY52568.1 DNA helicase II/ATP-dependent DNA helicase PcrA [Exophiala dermatitidis NIH/UT8656]